jgi:uncharacterized protein (DUF983 family)
MCRCPGCGAETEIFSDEFDRKHICSKCGREIDFSRCDIRAAGRAPDPR